MSFFVTANADGAYDLTTAGYTALILVFIALLLAGAAVFGTKKKMSTKQLVFSAMAIALAVVTSMIKLFDLPMGGSVTLFSMLFIVLIGYWYGFGGGLTAALAYGVLQLLIDPYILSFPQMLVDYILAFGALGLAGLFHNSKHGLIKGLYRRRIRTLLLRFPVRLDLLWHVCTGYLPKCRCLLTGLQWFLSGSRGNHHFDRDRYPTGCKGIGNREKTSHFLICFL